MLDADPDVEGNVIEIYTQRSVAASLSGSTDGWNREHLWPKSYGVFESGADYTDLHHLRAADWGVNSARSNKYFGECTPSDTGTPNGCTSPANSQAADSTAATTLLFQPPTSVRGDIARALFYMATRYDGTDRNTEDLVLTKCPDKALYAMGNLTTLLQWHEEDPVSAREVWRNHEVCDAYQNNRNPFVDYPGLVERIWGNGYADFSDPACDASVVPSATPTAASPTAAQAASPSPAPTADAPCLLLTGIIDGDRPGGLPKAVELYATCDVADMASYSLGSAANGGGSGGEEFSFSSGPTSLKGGQFVFVNYESASYAGAFEAFFGFSSNYSSSAVNINGNDAIELFKLSHELPSVGGRIPDQPIQCAIDGRLNLVLAGELIVV